MPTSLAAEHRQEPETPGERLVRHEETRLGIEGTRLRLGVVVVLAAAAGCLLLAWLIWRVVA